MFNQKGIQVFNSLSVEIQSLVMLEIYKYQDILEEIETFSEIYIQTEPPNNLKGRPIIADQNSPTQRLSSLLEKILTPLIPKLKSYIKDDWDFLKKLTKNLDPNFTFLMCDIVSLYTSILHELCLRTLLYYKIQKATSD